MSTNSISSMLTALAILPAAAAPVSYFTGHIKSETDLFELKATGVIGAVNFTTSPVRAGDFNAGNPNPSVSLNGIAFLPVAGAGAAGISGATGGVNYDIGGFQNDNQAINNNIGFDVNRQSGVDYVTSPLLYGLAYDVIRTSGNNIMMSAAFSNLTPAQSYTIQFIFSSGDGQRRLYLNNEDATNNQAAMILGYGVNDGMGVLTATFTADATGTQNFQFFNTNAGSQRVSLAGFTVAKVASSYSVVLDQNQFVSGAKQGTEIGMLSSFAPGADPDAGATFTLVSGEGATDNSLFQIAGNRLQIGKHDFRGDAETGTTTYSVRVRGNSGGGSPLTGERMIKLVMTEDDDLDDLPDDWERKFAGNLTTLSGLNGHDADGDTLTDLDEFNLSATYPALNPTLADSDKDGLSDSKELYLYSTNPTSPDSDNDGLMDGQEIAAGTDPLFGDSDGDGWRDGVEVARGTNPMNFDSRPSLPASVGIGLLTDDASTGISTSRIYTHAVSGGAAATVNGVAFDALTTTAAPANFTWDVSTSTKNVIVNNNNQWIPAQGGVTGPGLLSLLGSFAYPGGKAPGSNETFTLSNLTPGQTYEARLYLRSWDLGGPGRPIDLSFINGTDEVVPFSAILLDHPDATFPTHDRNSAYYVSYRYVAQGTEMKIRATIPQTELESNPATGGMHLYGLSNEQIGVVPATLKVRSVSRSAAGEILIDFTGGAARSYRVTKSATPAGPYIALTVPLAVATDAAGAGHVVIPASEASEVREFYRVEE